MQFLHVISFHADFLHIIMAYGYVIVIVMANMFYACVYMLWCIEFYPANNAMASLNDGSTVWYQYE